jgi:hypothetical protein
MTQDTRAAAIHRIVHSKGLTNLVRTMWADEENVKARLPLQ